MNARPEGGEAGPGSNADFNREMARQFRTAASLLREQDADHHRVAAYEHGADELERLGESAASIYRREGLAGLIALPAIGRALASAIADLVEFGHWRWFERLSGDVDPEKTLASIPTVGPALAHRLHTELHVETLGDLERAVYDGRLGRMRGVGDKRWHAIRDALLARRRLTSETSDRSTLGDQTPEEWAPTPDLLLSIDAEYRTKSDLNQLPTIAPSRFNPTRAHWLPVLHTERDGQHFTVMFSNTARAHELGRTDDWVVISVDGTDDLNWTVVTERTGPRTGERSIRGGVARAARAADRRT